MSAKGKEYKLAVRIAGVVDKSYEAALVSAGAQMKTFKATMGQIDGTFNKFDKGFDKIASVGKKAFHAIATAAGVAAAAVGGVVAKSISIGSEFESEMSAVQSISGATAAELDQLTAKAREVAKESVYSATEVGQAMEYMGMAGWDASQMMSGIEGIIALAAASGEDLAMVSDIVTDSLTAMGQGAEEATHFADIMAQAATNSNTNVSLMGETFKYVAPVAGALGYSMEDLAIATGTMANSGIKGSLAGTSLRNMLTRMAKPTKESQDAMDALGLSLTDAEGNMNSLLDIMNQLRSAFSGGKNTEAMQSALTELAGLTDEQITEVQDSLGDLSEAEEAFYAAELGGQRGMSGLLAIANSTDEEFGKLTDAIYGAEGAAKEMSEVRLDNLQGDVTILRDTLSDSAIELYYQFNDQLRGVVQGITGFIGETSDKIPGLWKKISEGFPTIKRKFTQYAKPVLDTAKGMLSWIIDNGDKVISVIGAIAGGMTAFKIEEGAFRFIKWISSIGSIGISGGVIAGIAGLAGAITGVATAMKLAHEAAVKQNLADHFGTLSLTMEELAEAAEYLTSTDALLKVRDALDEFSNLEPIESNIKEALDEINKANWKVSIGMELDAEDQESYKSAIDTYIQNAQEYALQARYAVSVNLATSFDSNSSEESDLLSKIDQFYADQYDELARIGTELNKAVTDAFNDGLLEIDEVETIANLQKQMAEVQEALAIGEFDASLSGLGMKYGGEQLTADSFMNLQSEINSKLEENENALLESYIKNQSSISAAYSGGKLSDSEYESASRIAASGYQANNAEMAAKALQYQLDTIYKQYDIEELNNQLNQVMSEALDTYLNPDSEYFRATDGVSKMTGIKSMFDENIDNILGENIDAIKVLADAAEQGYSELASSYSQLKETAEEFKAAGQQVPEDVSSALESTKSALDQFEQLDSLLNLDLSDTSAEHAMSVYKYMEEVLNGGAYDEILAMEDNWGNSIGESLGEALNAGIEANASSIGQAATSAYNKFSTEAQNAFNTPIEIAAKLNISTEMYYSSPSYWRNQVKQQNSGKSPSGHADGGFVQSKELSWLAEKGPEVVIPLDQSRNAIDLWTKTGQILGMDSLADRFDLSGSSTTNNATITYSPTLQFYGEAPSRKDLDDALHMSQDEFNDMMDQYIKQNDRVSFR